MSSVSILLLCTLAIASSLVIPQNDAQDRGLISSGKLCPQCKDFIDRGERSLGFDPNMVFTQKWVDFTTDHECNNLGVMASECQTAFHKAIDEARLFQGLPTRFREDFGHHATELDGGCYLFVTPLEGTGFSADFMIGEPLLSTYCTVFDIGLRRIGFAAHMKATVILVEVHKKGPMGGKWEE